MSDLVSFFDVAKNLLARLSEVSAVRGMNCSTLMFGSPGEQYTTLFGQIQYAWKALMAASGLGHRQSQTETVRRRGGEAHGQSDKGIHSQA